MKTIMKILVMLAVLVVLLTLSGCSDRSTPTVHNPNEPVSYQTFYDELSPYGAWVNYPPYGYAWSPDAYGFTPYSTAGNWIYTSYGWTWNSYYSWGWAPFHYGRWTYDIFYGWLWVPDTVWGPAWVTWRFGAGYCGWAPIAPTTATIIVKERIPAEQWTFVRSRDISNRYIERYRTSASKNKKLIGRAPFVREGEKFGPDKSEVEKYTGKKVTQLSVTSMHNPGNSRLQETRYEIYKPKVHRQDVSATKKSMPRHVVQPEQRPFERRNAPGFDRKREEEQLRRNHQQQLPPFQPQLTPRTREIGVHPGAGGGKKKDDN